MIHCFQSIEVKYILEDLFGKVIDHFMVVILACSAEVSNFFWSGKCKDYFEWVVHIDEPRCRVVGDSDFNVCATPSHRLTDALWQTVLKESGRIQVQP